MMKGAKKSSRRCSSQESSILNSITIMLLICNGNQKRWRQRILPVRFECTNETTGAFEHASRQVTFGFRVQCQVKLVNKELQNLTRTPVDCGRST